MAPDLTSIITNFETFVRCISPAVSCSYSYQDGFANFNLGDLWRCYSNWSICGLGVPIINQSGKVVVQYFMPYLSAVQIYIKKEALKRKHSNMMDAYKDFDIPCWAKSDVGKLARSSSSRSDKASDGADLCKEQEDKLYFEHFESYDPASRIPLRFQIEALSYNYPGLKALNTVDLSQASWVAVAWYPVCAAPLLRNERDYLACFLTYHSLSSAYQGSVDNRTRIIQTQDFRTGFLQTHFSIVVPPFALVPYNMQEKIWLNKDRDYQSISYLSGSAEWWLRRLQIQHNDFNLFTSRPM